MWLRKELTPEMISYVTAFDSDNEHEECHFLFVMMLWVTSRCFLLPEQSKRDEMRELFLGFIEMTLALCFITFEVFLGNYYCWAVCYIIFGVVLFLNRFAKHLKLTAVIFIFVYGVQNLFVNLIDQFVFEDGNRGDLFGYKLFNFVSTCLVSWVYAQSLNPTLDIVKTHASPILCTAFKLTDISNLLLLISVVYEVTAMPQEVRSVTFSQYLTKTVLMLSIYYFLIIYFSNYLLSTAIYSKAERTKLAKYEDRRQRIGRSYERTKDFSKFKKRERNLQVPYILRQQK